MRSIFAYRLRFKNFFKTTYISICDVNDNKVRFIFQVKGEGTKELSQMNPGDVIDIMGPAWTWL